MLYQLCYVTELQCDDIKYTATSIFIIRFVEVENSPANAN